MENSKTLILCRHADAEHTSDGDFERELSSTGMTKAIQSAQWLIEHDFLPDLIVYSPAERTRQTKEIIAKEIKFAGNERIEAKIYRNNFMEINRLISKIEARYQTVLLIGHNPSMTQLAGQFASIHRFPTAGCLSLTFDVLQWNQLDPIFLKNHQCNFSNY